MYARQKSRDISTGGNHCRGKDNELEKKRKRLSNAQKASVHEDTVFGERTEDVVGDGTEDVVGDGTEDVVGEGTEDVVGEGTEDVVGDGTEDVVGERTEDIRVLHSLQ